MVELTWRQSTVLASAGDWGGSGCWVETLQSGGCVNKHLAAVAMKRMNKLEFEWKISDGRSGKHPPRDLIWCHYMDRLARCIFFEVIAICFAYPSIFFFRFVLFDEHPNRRELITKVLWMDWAFEQIFLIGARLWKFIVKFTFAYSQNICTFQI